MTDEAILSLEDTSHLWPEEDLFMPDDEVFVFLKKTLSSNKRQASIWMHV